MTPEPLSLHMSAVALMREPAGVLMVESSYPGYTDTFWAMPGGMLERGESMVDALAREVREETGLEIAGPCRIAAVIWLLTSEGAPHWVTFVCEPSSWTGALSPQDPDAVTLRADLVPIEEAIRRLSSLPWGLSEPIVQRLAGAPIGGIWVYRWNGAGPWDGEGPAQLVSGPATNA